MARSKVFVGISGGVDSSVAASLLQKAGYQVTGVFIKSWIPVGFDDFCTWREDRRDAMRVAAHLGIPFLTLDLSGEYKKTVLGYMLSEYRAGRTPNPDVECNRTIKFGAFFDWAVRRGAAFVATGHYARIARRPALKLPTQTEKSFSGRRLALLVGCDAAKDQSYFLWTLTQRHLARCVFPVGEYTKSEVRRLAKKFGLPNWDKKDSQGLCFVGQLNLKEFLKTYIKPRPGAVIDEAGRVIGGHDGARFYTIGERHGFTVNAGNGPYYVIAKDVKKNVLFVSRQPPVLDGSAGVKIVLTGVNWLSGERPSSEKTYLARIRHGGDLVPVDLFFSQNRVLVRPRKNLLAVAPGQSLVLYDGEVVLGGGVIRLP